MTGPSGSRTLLLSGPLGACVSRGAVMSGPLGKHTRSWSRRLLGAVCALLVLATMVAIGAPPFDADEASAATESKLPKSELEIVYQQGFGDSGDIPMPDCGSWNIEGRRGAARWTISSSLGSG